MRVMILEDDVWIADLLKQIVHSLRPGTQVVCHPSLGKAVNDWQSRAADLLICDWNLPDGPGTTLLERVRQDDQQVPLVMVTGRADRDSVLAVRSLRISAFISKPFQVPKVLECLDRLLPAFSDAPTVAASSAGSFIEFLDSQADSALDLPLQAGMQAKLDALGRQQPSVRQLQQAWQDDPTLTGRLLAAANSRQYNTSATPCLSLGQALQILGPTTSLNIGIGRGPNPPQPAGGSQPAPEGGGAAAADRQPAPARGRTGPGLPPRPRSAAQRRPALPHGRAVPATAGAALAQRWPP